MKKIRVLYIEANRDGTIGGSYYSLFYLIEGLDKNLFEPIVMFYEKNPLIPKFKKIVNEVLVIGHDSPKSSQVKTVIDGIKLVPRLFRDIFLAQFKLGKLINQIKPDIVHFNNSYAANHDWVLACRRKGVKIVAHDRGTRPCASFQTKIFIRFIDATISVSDAYLKYVKDQGLKPKKAIRVYNGLDANKFNGLYSSKQKNEIRQSFNLGENQILIGMVGNITFWKGQIVLVKAMKLVKKKYGNVKVAIVGKTAYGSEKYEYSIRKYISENKLNDTVFLTGYRTDIPALLNAFDIFVHASVEPEPFGRVILEAMAMKKPIIATKSGGTVEQIIDGESGLLIPMNDVSAMAEAIIRYLDDIKSARLIGINSWNRLKDNFSISKMVEGVESVYKEVLKY